MRPRRGLGPLLFLLVAVLGSTSPARAWTQTVVKGARATVDVERDATLRILLRLDVEVDAGWLQEIELAELGTGIELDRNKPPYFRSEDGEIFRPEAEVLDDGLIRLSFPRKDAPRQGEYQLFIRYRAKADLRIVEAAGQSRARIVWSVPAWETGLHNISVEFRAPGGSTVPAELHDTPPGVELRVAEHPNRTVIEWRRIHLPRMSAWSLSLDVPVESIALPIEASDAPAPSGFRPLTIPQERPIVWCLLLLSVVVLLKRRSLESRMGPGRLLIRVPWVAVSAVVCVTLAIGQWLAPVHPVCALALIALALHRPTKLSGPAECPAWHPARMKDLPGTNIPASDFLDGSTVTGLTTLIAGGASLVGLSQPTAALLLLPVFFTGTRHHMAATVARKADVLRRFASELRLGAEAPGMSFSWEVSFDGMPRLRIHLPTHRAGLISLGLVVASSSLGCLVRHKTMLLVETRAQSDADDIVRRRTNANPDLRAADGSILRLIEWNAEAMALLGTLARDTPKPMEPSRGTWLLREISEPGRKAA
jgi:hypothetical protein